VDGLFRSKKCSMVAVILKGSCVLLLSPISVYNFQTSSWLGVRNVEAAFEIKPLPWSPFDDSCLRNLQATSIRLEMRWWRAWQVLIGRVAHSMRENAKPHIACRTRTRKTGVTFTQALNEYSQVISGETSYSPKMCIVVFVSDVMDYW
jgi:hypothetical protein